MKIYRNDYNTPQMQIEENKKNIQLLASYLKESYHTNEGVELNTSSISVAKSLTNADQDVVNGWLLDSVGSLFKITGGDESSLLIEFYSSFRGMQGEQGEQGVQGSDGARGYSMRYYNNNYVDDSTTYTISQKLFPSIDLQDNDIILFSNDILCLARQVTSTTFKVVKVANVGIPTITIDVTQFTDETHAQLTDNQYNIAANNSIVNIITPVNSRELAFLKYTNDNATYIGFGGILAYNSTQDTYSMENIDIDTTTKIATIVSKTFPKGKQLYQHNIELTYLNYDNNNRVCANLIIISSKSDAYTKQQIGTYVGSSGRNCFGFVNTNVIKSVSYQAGSEQFQFNYWTGSTHTYMGLGINSSLSINDKIDTIQ